MSQQTTRDTAAEQSWHTLSVKDVLQELKGQPEGLSENDVRARQNQFGPNQLPENPRPGLWVIFLRQFKNPLIYVLLLAGMVSISIGATSDAIFIFAVLLINSIIGTTQEWKAETSADMLKHVIKTIAKVSRGRQRQEIDASKLVPGDIVFVESGDAVPADVRLVSSKSLQADESLLTGESVPVKKTAKAILEQQTPLAERENLLHAGSTVVEGRAKGIVCRTGAETEVGRIATSLAEEASASPLVIRLEQFTRSIAYVIVGVVLLLSAVQLYKGAELSHIFLLAVALAVSAIPAGLPVAITVALSLGTRRMADRHVIVRQLPAVEGLGACTLIASDKTGTLTANKLTVKRIVMHESPALDVEGEGLSPEGAITHDGESITDNSVQEQLGRLILSGTLCNEGEFEITDQQNIRHRGDAVDIAFLVLANKHGMNHQNLQKAYPQVGNIPFESQRRFSASFHREKDHTIMAHVKGAAETVLPMCSDVEQEWVKSQEQELAAQGYRVLAVASGEVSEEQVKAEDETPLRQLSFLGLVGVIDPIRKEVPEALDRCQRAGIRVCMVTGDHPSTARAIANQAGLQADDESVVTGTELVKLEHDENALDKKVEHATVFARVEPAHKTQIVKSLQRLKHFVAVTGDGVNDAPALKAANIGVAMGEGGTDVARGAADLILTDNNFASIFNGVEVGRLAYSNVRKVTWLLISTGAAEIAIFFLSLLTGLPLPLYAVQLLWLNLVTNGVQDVAMAFEKEEPGLIDRPPRPSDQPIFDRLMIEQTVVSGAYMGSVAFGLFYWLLEHAGFNEFEARNFVLLLMVLFENVHIFNCRSEHRAFYHVPLHSNPFLIFAVGIAQGIHILAMYVPGLNDVLQLQPVSFMNWIVLLLMAISLLLVMEVYKYWRVPKLADAPHSQAIR